MQTMFERFRIEYFEGSHYYEVYLDGQVITTTQTKREADLFIAEAILRASHGMK